jgi:CheY-like chemotaxis protein
MAQADRPDVILMDINLPGISGLTALKILAGDAATAHIPVVALSANAMPRDIEKGLRGRLLPLPDQADQGAEFMDTLDLALQAAHQTAAGPAARGQAMTIEQDIPHAPHPGRRRPGGQRAAADAC